MPRAMRSEETSAAGRQSQKDVSEQVVTAKLGVDQLPDVEKNCVPEDLKLDTHGLPLVPQPSQWRDDPLNWPGWLKWTVLIQVSFMAFLGPFNAAVVNPSLVLLSKGFHTSVVRATYSTQVSIIFGGVASFIWAPLTNYYGRRPVTLISQLFAILGQVGAGKSKTYSALIANRAINGCGMGGMMSVGTACVADLFFLHERGEKTGVYTIFVTNGAHFAAIIGGFIGDAAGWQWDFYAPGIITGGSMAVAVLLLPETIFSRDPEYLSRRNHERTYWEMLFNFRSNMIPGRRLSMTDFLTPFYMCKYPSIVLPTWFYLWSWTFINILPAISMANIYTSLYHLKAGPIGVCTGVSLLIGTVIGEMSAGKLSDYIMYRLAKRNNGVRIPEHRLYLTSLAAIFMPSGMIIFGWCIQNKTHFVAPLVGLAVGCLGLQIASTCVYAYVSDCYKPQTPESGVLLNLARGVSFVVGFFGLQTAAKIGYGWTWTTFALILFVFWFPILWLMRYGQHWRQKLGTPRFHQFI